MKAVTGHRLKWGLLPSNEVGNTGREKEGKDERTGVGIGRFLLKAAR